MQEFIGIPLGPRALPFVFGAQPLAKPSAGVSFHRSVGFADRTEAEVVRPSDDLAVEHLYQRLGGLLSLTSSSRFANRLTDALHPFLRRGRAQIGPARLRRIAPTKRVSRPAEFHRQPLVEPSVRLSPHSAPIRQTCRSSRVASERRDPRAPWQAVGETGWPGSCGL
jgi:hypothetical protein